MCRLNRKRSMRALVLAGWMICLGILLLAACGPPAPHETITVMTYNILMGAGADTVSPANKEWAARAGYPGDRLPRVLEVIKTADPDILAVQEAHQWDIGSPSVAQKVADELGMNYFIAESNAKNGEHVVLFTKFDIKEAESYPPPITKSALRAELVTPSGESIHVFVVHLSHVSYQTRMVELLFLVGEMEPYINDLTMLMGDVNFCDNPWLQFLSFLLGAKARARHRRGAMQAAILKEEGWRHCSGKGLDHIWASSRLAPYVQLGHKIPSELTSSASDHRPVVAKIRIP